MRGIISGILPQKLLLRVVWFQLHLLFSANLPILGNAQSAATSINLFNTCGEGNNSYAYYCASIRPNYSPISKHVAVITDGTLMSAQHKQIISVQPKTSKTSRCTIEATTRATIRAHALWLPTRAWCNNCLSVVIGRDENTSGGSILLLHLDWKWKHIYPNNQLTKRLPLASTYEERTLSSSVWRQWFDNTAGMQIYAVARSAAVGRTWEILTNHKNHDVRIEWQTQRQSSFGYMS